MSAPAEEMQEASPPSPSAVVARLQLNVHSLSTRVHSLAHRFAASQGTLSDPLLLSHLGAAGHEVVLLARQLSCEVVKEWEGAAEAARVAAAQLQAYATLLEREVEDGEDQHDGVAHLACALLCCEDWKAQWLVAVERDTAALLRIRDGVDAQRCVVNGHGDGVKTYRSGDNRVTVTALDCVGDVVESIEAGDACVSVEGGVVVSVTLLGEVGVVEVVYHVPEGRVAPVTLAVSVCGGALAHWTVVCATLSDSVILASVAPERTAAFLRELSGWLPGRAYTPLYRGSRDGMTAAAFHGLCGGKGPTLVLVRCDKGWVFGGYAGASWASPLIDEPEPGQAFETSVDAFLFSVTGPHTDAPVSFPVTNDNACTALYCHPSCGPIFFGGILIASESCCVTDSFDEKGSSSYVGVGYEDTLGMGRASLTGAAQFLPVELEVYAVSTA